MKIKLLKIIEAPDGATHYTGWLNGQHSWYRQSEDGPWQVWEAPPLGRGWRLYGGAPPQSINALNIEGYNEIGTGKE